MNLFRKILLIALLLPLFSLAQSNYQPGVVVTLKGDTLHGFINYSEWENNPQSILFKLDSSSSPGKLTINDIKYFNVNVGHLADYIKYDGLISTDNTEINHLAIGRDTSFKQETIFLKVLQKGKNFVFLSYSDDQKTRYFITENPADNPTELIFRIFYNNNEANDRDKTIYENTYKSQLYEAGLKCGSMTESLKDYIKKAEYREQDIVYIASKINQVSETDLSKNNLSKPRPLNKAFAITAILIIGVGLVSEFAH
jgi:hypothetical protein